MSVTGSKEVPGLDWSNGRLIPTFQAPSHLDIYDIFGASPNVALTITTLVGLINRPQPRVYLVMGGDEEFWRVQSLQHIPQAVSPVKANAVLDELLTHYGNLAQGVIVYDPNLADSINVATVMAAQQNALIASPQLLQTEPRLQAFKVLADLRTFGWHSRAQVYDWALHNLRTGCSSRLVAGLDPKNTSLRPFLVATRTFIYSLDSRDYLPDFSDHLNSERHLLREILATYPAGATHLGWFIDESSGVKLTSQAAIPVLATDIFTNLEVWTSVQPQAPATLSAAPNTANATPSVETVVPEDGKVYVSFTISDGDNLQYIQHHMKDIWRDTARGSLPIGWTISPTILQIAPSLAHYYLDSVTPNDEFIAGPSGAGYMFPSHWPDEQLNAFLNSTGSRMQEMGLTLVEILDTQFLESSGLPLASLIFSTGMSFIDDNRQQQFVEGLRPYGLRGILSGAGVKHPEWKVLDGVPFYQNLGLAGNVKQTVDMIQSAMSDNKQRPLFLNVYILAWSMNPSLLKEVVQQLGEQCEIVRPSTLLAMLSKAGA